VSIKLYYGMWSDRLLHEVYGELKTLQALILNVMATPWIDPQKYFSEKSMEQRRSIDETCLRTSLQLVPVEDGTLAIPSIDESLCLALGMKRSEVLTLLQKQTSLKPFPYWDNADTPPDVSAEEWERRRKIWSCCSFPEHRSGVLFLLSEMSDFINLEGANARSI
jgi:hypothetical protein